MTVLDEAGALELTDLRELTPEQLALEAGTAGIVARLVRADEVNGDGSEVPGWPVQVEKVWNQTAQPAGSPSTRAITASATGRSPKSAV